MGSGVAVGCAVEVGSAVGVGILVAAGVVKAGRGVCDAGCAGMGHWPESDPADELPGSHPLASARATIRVSAANTSKAP